MGAEAVQPKVPMKTSELIAILQQSLVDNGDLPVGLFCQGETDHIFKESIQVADVEVKEHNFGENGDELGNYTIEPDGTVKILILQTDGFGDMLTFKYDDGGEDDDDDSGESFYNHGNREYIDGDEDLEDEEEDERDY